jgi:cyclohexyl-isocyanide hydratase
MPPLFTLLALIYPNFNTLDLNGPVEVLGNAAARDLNKGEPIFKIIIAAASSPTPAFEGVSIASDSTLSNALQLVKDRKVDLLLIPGAGGTGISDMLANNTKDKQTYFQIISTFATTSGNGPSGNPRWLISISVGASLVGFAGGLAGLTATTHWNEISSLYRACQQYMDRNGQMASDKTNVVRKRWVDGGKNKAGVRILSSGGVSCGIDCALWYLSQALTLQEAVDTAMLMDYHWNYTHEFLVPSSVRVPVNDATSWTTPGQ